MSIKKIIEGVRKAAEELKARGIKVSIKPERVIGECWGMRFYRGNKVEKCKRCGLEIRTVVRGRHKGEDYHVDCFLELIEEEKARRLAEELERSEVEEIGGIKSKEAES